MNHPQNMTMRLQTLLPKEPGTIRHDRALLLMGSCFSTEVGAQLRDRGFPVGVNPFGTLYNPISLMELLSDPGPDYFAGLNVERDGYWVNYRLHSKLRADSEEHLMMLVRKQLDLVGSLLPRCGLVVLTFGTAWVWSLRKDGRSLGNLHKQPQHLFERRLLGVEEIVHAFESWYSSFQSRNPGCKVILTVSPVLHGRSELHENNLSKAVLLLATHALRERWPEVAYFPSYEIVRDELRDYRFYADDMQHPSPAAIRYVTDCFLSSYADAETLALANALLAQGKRAAHRVEGATEAMDWPEIWRRNGVSEPVIDLVKTI